MKEWSDVGHAVEDNLQKTHNGIHLPNSAFNEISDELDDVADHYEYLGTTHWKKDYEQAYGELFQNEEAKKVEFAAKKFRFSPGGKMLHKEVEELGHAIEDNVRVTGVPAKWKRAMNGLRVEIDEEGQHNIHDAAKDVQETWEDIEDSTVVRRVGKSAMKWGMSEEVEELKELDAEFKGSEDGQDLMNAWKAFGEAIEDAVEPTENGFHIHNDKMEAVEDAGDDVEGQYEYLETTHWKDDFEDAFEAAFSNGEARRLGKALERFDRSREHDWLKEDVEDLFETIEEEVEVTDVPKEWMEDFEDATEEAEHIADDHLF